MTSLPAFHKLWLHGAQERCNDLAGGRGQLFPSQVSVHSSQDTLTLTTKHTREPISAWCLEKKTPLLKRPQHGQPQVTDFLPETVSGSYQASLEILILSPPTSSVLGLQPCTKHSLYL